MADTASERHNRLAPEIITKIIRECGYQESEAMVVIESVVLGALRFFRPDDPRAQILFLETMTEALVDRIGASHA